MGIPVRLVYQVYQSFWTGLDWLYPPRCGGCGQDGSRWCAACAGKVRLVTAPVCPRCGKEQKHNKVCEDCVQSLPAYTALRSWAEYAGPLRNAIQRLKYHRDVAMGEILARPMIACLTGLHWAVDWVVPVPASLARLSERGYNQVSLLARPIALSLGYRYQPNALVKVRETRSQVGLSAAERQVNVSGAFAAGRQDVKEKTILVVDDVTTTGSTLTECAQALKKAGAREVYGFTLARSVFVV
jgi:competence protein ComFC